MFAPDGYKSRDLRMKWDRKHPIEIEKDVTIAQFTLLQRKINETYMQFHHGKRHITLIVPTFDTKVTEYLCSGWVFFFFRQISTF